MEINEESPFDFGYALMTMGAVNVAGLVSKHSSSIQLSVDVVEQRASRIGSTFGIEEVISIPLTAPLRELFLAVQSPMVSMTQEQLVTQDTAGAI